MRVGQDAGRGSGQDMKEILVLYVCFGSIPTVFFCVGYRSHTLQMRVTKRSLMPVYVASLW
jgi:hypothetical protein